MWYAQENYQEKVGNSKLTIKQIGCFVTADCNLAIDFNENIDPSTLNSFYESKGFYTYDLTDKANDDITWNTISHKFPNIVMEKVVSEPGWPNTNHAIVEFRFKSGNVEETHFCKVYDYTKKLIVDSYDGVVKEPGIYGEPIAYATYADTIQSAPVAPPNHTTVTTEPGWGLERIAAAAGRTDAAQIECWVAIAKTNGSSDWQTFNKNLKPGQKVIVPNQGGKGEGDDTDQPVPPAPVPSVNEPSSPFTMNTYGAGSYIANRSFDVYDLSNPKMPSQPLKKGDKVVVSGSFQVMGTTYARPFVAVKTNTWMGIPFGYLDKLPVQQTVPVQKISIGDKLFIAVASIVGFVTRKKAPKL